MVADVKSDESKPFRHLDIESGMPNTASELMTMTKVLSPPGTDAVLPAGRIAFP